MIEAHRFDGMVCIPNCDKIVPGMLMAAMRVNIPTIFVSGGPMAAGKTPDGQAVDLITVFEGVGAYQAGKIDAAAPEDAGRLRLSRLRLVLGHVHRQQHELPVEALGMALPGNGSVLADSPEREALARRAAQLILELVEQEHHARA